MTEIKFSPMRSSSNKTTQPPDHPTVNPTNTVQSFASSPNPNAKEKTLSFEVSHTPASQPIPFTREEIERFLYFLIQEIWSKPSVKGLNEEEKNRLKTAIKNVIRYVRQKRRDLLENPTRLESNRIYSDIFNELKELYRELRTLRLNTVEYSGFFIKSNKIRR
jgi:hypothetical protein